MSIVQMNLWKVTCDQCGKSTQIETYMDFSPDGMDLVNNGFIRVYDVPSEGGPRHERHYCQDCAHEMMKEDNIG